MSLITTYITADAAGVFRPWSVCLVNEGFHWAAVTTRLDTPHLAVAELDAATALLETLPRRSRVRVVTDSRALCEKLAVGRKGVAPRPGSPAAGAKAAARESHAWARLQLAAQLHAVEECLHRPQSILIRACRQTAAALSRNEPGTSPAAALNSSLVNLVVVAAGLPSASAARNALAGTCFAPLVADLAA